MLGNDDINMLKGVEEYGYHGVLDLYSRYERVNFSILLLWNRNLVLSDVNWLKVRYRKATMVGWRMVGVIFPTGVTSATSEQRCASTS